MWRTCCCFFRRLVSSEKADVSCERKKRKSQRQTCTCIHINIITHAQQEFYLDDFYYFEIKNR